MGDEVLTDTTVAGKYTSVTIVSTLMATASLNPFSVSSRNLPFSTRACSARALRECPLSKSRRLDTCATG
jgi:hypothetical protein